MTKESEEVKRELLGRGLCKECKKEFKKKEFIMGTLTLDEPTCIDCFLSQSYPPRRKVR